MLNSWKLNNIVEVITDWYCLGLIEGFSCKKLCKGTLIIINYKSKTHCFIYEENAPLDRWWKIFFMIDNEKKEEFPW